LRKVRITHERGGALDHIFTNLEVEHAKIGEIKPEISDHAYILAALRLDLTEKYNSMSQEAPKVIFEDVRPAALSKEMKQLLYESLIHAPVRMQYLLQQSQKP